MKVYKFETEQFGLTSEGIHLLRNRYNYETITFGQIKKIRFEKSRIVNNWMILLISGLAGITFSVYYAFTLIGVFNDERVHSIYIEEIMIPFLPFIFGLFMVYTSLRAGSMMIVFYDNKRKRLSLEKLKKEGTLEAFLKDVNQAEYKQGKEIQYAAYV